MTLTVETGSGSSTADAFVSVADFRTYSASRGRDVGEADYAEILIEEAIRRGTSYLCAGFPWKGYRTHGRDQALSWPRTGVTDGECEAVASDELPVEVVQACCEVSYLELLTPGCMTPVVNLTERIRREKVGSLEVEYAPTANSAEASRPSVLLVQGILAGLLASTGGGLSGLTGRA